LSTLSDHFQVLIAAKYGGHDLKLDEDFEFGTTNKGPSEIFLTLDDNGQLAMEAAPKISIHSPK